MYQPFKSVIFNWKLKFEVCTIPVAYSFSKRFIKVISKCMNEKFKNYIIKKQNSPVKSDKNNNSKIFLSIISAKVDTIAVSIFLTVTKNLTHFLLMKIQLLIPLRCMCLIAAYSHIWILLSFFYIFMIFDPILRLC